MKLKKILSSALVFVMLFTSIVAVIPVGASAAEAESSVTVNVKANDETATNADKVKEICDEYLKYGFGDLKFNTAEEMLQYEIGKGYLDSIESANYSLYVNRYTGFVYYKNNLTGQILTSNPIDPAYQTQNENNIVSIGAKNSAVMSQLEIEYFQVTNTSNKASYNSLHWIQQGSLLQVSEIENGISVLYTLGESVDGFIAPAALTSATFKAHITEPLFDKLEALLIKHCGEFDADFAKDNAIKMRNRIANKSEVITSYNAADLPIYYANGEYHLTQINEAMKVLRSYASAKLGGTTSAAYNEINALASNITTITSKYNCNVPAEMDEDQLKLYAESIPVLAEGVTVYYMEENAVLTTLRIFNKAIKAALPEYTMEMAAADMEECGFVGGTTNVPSFKIAINYTFAEDGSLSIEIPSNSIQFNEEVYTIASIVPLRYFGAGDMSQDGYIFFPDGSGTIVEFEDFYAGGDANKKATNMSVNSKVYGQDYCYSTITGAHREQVTMPVYGMVSMVNSTEKTKSFSGSSNVTNGFFTIVEEGSALSSFAISSDSASHKFAYIYTSYAPYPSDSVDLSQSLSVSGLGAYTMVADGGYEGSFRSRIVMLTDETVGAAAHSQGVINNYYPTSYVGMSVYYRDYLNKMGIIEPLTEVADTLPLYIEALGSIDVLKRILTFPVTVSESLTTFEDIETMYKEFSNAVEVIKAKADQARAEAEATDEDDILVREQYLNTAAKYDELATQIKNIVNVNFRLTGFANGGMYFTYPTKVKWQSSVGGKRGFRNLLDAAKTVEEETGNTFGIYPDFDFMYISNTAAFDGVSKNRDAASLVDNRYASKQVYNSISQEYESLFSMLVSADSLDRLYSKFYKKYSKYDVNTLSVSTLGSDLNSNLDKDNLLTREDSLGYVEALLSRMAEENDYSLMTDVGNIYTVKYMDHILNVSTDSSHFRYSSYTVPFYGMVLHGFVNYAGSPLNYSGSPDYDILRSIENGASLYYILCCENTNYLKEDLQLSEYYGIDYSNWFEKIVEEYAVLDEAIGGLQKYNIVDHKVVLAERVISDEEMVANYDHLATEFVTEINNNISSAIDIKIKEMRNNGQTALGLDIQIDRTAVITQLALLVGAELDSDDAEEKAEAENTLAAMLALASIKSDLESKVASYEAAYPAELGAKVVTVTAEDLVFENAEEIAVSDIVATIDKIISDKIAAAALANQDQAIEVNIDLDAVLNAAYELTGLNEVTVDAVLDLESVIADYEKNYNSTNTGAVVLEFGKNEKDYEYESLYSYTTESNAFDKKNYKYTDFTCDNGNVVMVTYDDPDSDRVVEFILNYNTFAVEVILADGSEPVVINAYGYHKIIK